LARLSGKTRIFDIAIDDTATSRPCVRIQVAGGLSGLKSQEKKA
jgi:hypothetical protein